MRGISREVLARDAAWSLADGSCKDLTVEWARWEATYAASLTPAARQAALMEPSALCADCPIAVECADLAGLSGYTGIAAAHRPARPSRSIKPGEGTWPKHRSRPRTSSPLPSS